MKKREKRNLKSGHCASSSGEELYSIAMEIEEYIKKHNCRFKYTIIGTDISTRGPGNCKNC